jgi:outer membrane protein assembly factor BamB
MHRPLSIGLLLLMPLSLDAADWPQWRGPSRDCRLADNKEWPESLDGNHLIQSWQIPLAPSYSGPIVWGNKVFVTETQAETNEIVRALDRKTGEELWKAQWPGAISVPFFARENGSWIRSTPATDGQSLYVAGIRDVLVSLDIETGKENWRIDIAETFDAPLPGFGTVCSPLIDGQHLYLQAAASVVKINSTDGSVVWRSRPESGGLFGSGMGASAFSSPVMATIVGTRQLVVQSRKSLSGIDLESGEKLWSIDVEAFRGMNILTPTVIGNSVFTSTYGGGTFLYDVQKSANQFSVTQRWNTKKQGYMSSPVVVDDKVYLHLRNQRFTCIDPETGATIWTTRPFGKYWSIVANGDRLLALDQTGDLHLISATPDDYQELSTRTISESETWAHLAVSDDQLFIRSLNALTTWYWR